MAVEGNAKDVTREEEKALLSIARGEAPQRSVTYVMEDSEKALSPMAVSEAGMIMLVRPEF